MRGRGREPASCSPQRDPSRMNPRLGFPVREWSREESSDLRFLFLGQRVRPARHLFNGHSS